MEQSYQISTKRIYELAFGKNASKTEVHKKNYDCTEKLVELVMGIVDAFFSRLEKILEARAAAYQVAYAKEREYRRWHRRHPTRSITSSYEEKEKMKTHLVKRGAGAVMLAGLSVLSLAGQVTSSVYYGIKISSLTNYILSIQKQVESDYNTVKAVANNVRILKKEAKAVAIRSDSLYSSLTRLKEQNSCDALRTTANYELAALQSHFQTLYDDIVTSKLTTKVLPFATAMEIHGRTQLFDENLIASDPEFLYRYSTISLHSIDKERRTVNILLSYPRIKALPQYRKLNLLSPSTSVKVGSEFFSQYIDFSSESYAIPIRVQQQRGFSLTNMTRKQIESIRIAANCGQIGAYQFCRNFIPAGTHFVHCLEGLLQADSSKADWCSIVSSRQQSHMRFHIARGLGGVALTSVSELSVYGKKYPSDGGERLERPHLLTHHKQEANHTSCIYIPSTYSALEIREKDETTEIQLQGSMTVSFDAFQSYDVQHFKWIRNEFRDWLDPAVENMTILDREFRLQSMERHVIPLEPMESMTSPTFLMALAAMVLSVIAVFVGVCVARDGRCAKESPDTELARDISKSRRFKLWKRRRGPRAAEGSTVNLHEPSVQYSTGSAVMGGPQAIIVPVAAQQLAQQVAPSAAHIVPANVLPVPPQMAAQPAANAPIYAEISGARHGAGAGAVAGPGHVLEQLPQNVQTGDV